VAAGLRTRPLEQTVADTWSWIQQAAPEPVPDWGSAPEDEARLLREWHAAAGS
jgi:hypothetical protein